MWLSGLERKIRVNPANPNPRGFCVTTADDTVLRSVADELRSWGGVAIIGSGLSFGRGLPLTRHLTALLWQAVESEPSVHSQVARHFKQEGSSAKEIIGDEPERVDFALRAVAENQAARLNYQRGFAKLNSERVRTPSPPHQIIAEWLHRGVLETVISLNWDTLLEVAYHERYGSSLRPGKPGYYKPHGDAAQPEGTWVFPHEGGKVSQEMIGNLRRLVGERPRVLIIIGYSESDRVIVEQVIKPLSDHWRVVRIGPSASGALSIAEPAESALQRLTGLVTPEPELPGWEYVTFDSQNGLGAALAGRRLGPADVTACPRLPEVQTILRQLSVAHRVVLSGGSGTGKSITVYQAAYDLNCQEWEIARLCFPLADADTLMNGLGSLRHRTVFLVDDAHALDLNTRRFLLERASDTRYVLEVYTDDQAATTGDVQIAHGRAVVTLAEAITRRREEVLPLIRQLDDRVGEGYLDESLEERVRQASESETPWQFAFVLTGGWRRAKDHLAVLHDMNEADRLLAAIAVGQVILLDQGVSMEWLSHFASSIGRDLAWVENSLKSIADRRLIVGPTALRCPHMRYCDVILQLSSKSKSQADRLISLARLALAWGSPPLRGIAWLLQHLRTTDIWPVRSADLVDPRMSERFVGRCLSATSPQDRNDASILLDALRSWDKSIDSVLEANTDLLGRWIEEVSHPCAWGLGWLINDIWNESPTLAEGIIESVRPATLAAAFALITPAEAGAWGWLISRLGIGSKRWKQEFTESLNKRALGDLVAAMSPADIDQLNELEAGIDTLSSDLALSTLELAMVSMTHAINDSPIEAFNRLNNVFWLVLGFPPEFLRSNPPTERQMGLARGLVSGIDPGRIAAAISQSPRRAWEDCAKLIEFVHEVDRNMAGEITSRIDVESLDRTAAGLWGDWPRELQILALALSSDQDGEPAKRWVTAHENDLDWLNAVVAVVAPDVVARRIRTGAQLDLEVSTEHRWNLAVEAVRKLRDVRDDTAQVVLEQNRSAIADGLCAAPIDDGECDEITDMLDLVSNTPTLFDLVLAAIPVEAARVEWCKMLRGEGKRVQLAQRLARDAISRGPRGLASMASDLLYGPVR